MFKKTIKSRLFIFILGVLVFFSFYSAYAAWNTRVQAGTLLTPSLWNDIVDKLTDLDTRMGTIENETQTQDSCPCGTCWETKCGQNTQEFCTPAGWRSFSDVNVCGIHS